MKKKQLFTVLKKKMFEILNKQIEIFLKIDTKLHNELRSSSFLENKVCCCNFPSIFMENSRKLLNISNSKLQKNSFCPLLQKFISFLSPVCLSVIRRKFYAFQMLVCSFHFDNEEEFYGIKKKSSRRFCWRETASQLLVVPLSLMRH